MMNVTSVKRIHQSDWTSSGVRFLRARDIVALYKNEEPSDYLYISEEKYNEYSSLSGKVKVGDLLVTGVGTIGVPMLINDGNPLYFKDGNVIWFQNENKINGDFFYYSFIGNAIQSFIQESAGTGTVGTYTIDSGKKTPISLPTNESEQQKIGNYFRNLDHLITLHQRKASEMGNGIKGDDNRMFIICNLQKSIRNTNAWEQRELKELASFAKGSGYSKNDIKEQGTPLILYGRLYTKYETKIYEVDTFAEPQKGSIYSKGCEVIVPASGETSEDIARASYVAKSGILLGGDLNIIYPNDTIEPTFLALSISNGEQQKNLAKKAQGKSVVHLHNSDLETVNIVYPTRTEQARIGQYFDHLDTLITLHQRKPFRRC